MIFIDNKYTRCYYDIIHNAQNRSPELKEKYRQTHSLRISCLYCRKLVNHGILARFHGDNCKFKV